MTIKIGLITEGKTDQVVLKSLVPVAIPSIDKNNFIDLQPAPDRTSMPSSSEGGWRMVQKWCLNTSPELRLQMIQGGLFENSPKISVFIIQLDTDICDQEDFQEATEINPNSFNLNAPSGRYSYVKNVLDAWLWPDPNENTPESNLIIYAIAVEVIETWLIAALDDHEKPEKIKDYSDILLTIYHEIEGNKAQANQKKVAKKEKNYEKICNAALPEIQKIKRKCPHFKKFISSLQESLAELP